MDPRQLEPIARRHRLDLVVQFGSSVRGQTHAHSDCDIGVLFERMPDDIGVIADVAVELQPLSPGREVDSPS